MVCRRRHQREVTKRLRDGERADHTEEATGPAFEGRGGQHGADGCAHQHRSDEPAALRYDAARGGVSADRDYSRARPDEGTARPARP
jgi:hypothetical protein